MKWLVDNLPAQPPGGLIDGLPAQPGEMVPQEALEVAATWHSLEFLQRVLEYNTKGVMRDVHATRLLLIAVKRGSPEMVPQLVDKNKAAIPIDLLNGKIATHTTSSFGMD